MSETCLALVLSAVVLLNPLFHADLSGGDLQDILKMKKLREINRSAEKLMSEKKYKEALSEVEKGLEIDSNSSDLLVTAGKIYFAINDRLSSYESFKKAQELKPYDPYIRSWLSKIKIKDGKLSTEHFVFFRVPQSRKWVMKLPLEEEYNRISNVLDTYIPKPIELWFFEKEDEFFKVYGFRHLHKKGRLMGVSQHSRGRMLLSSIVSRKEMLSVIAHELVHFFIHHKMRDSKLYGIEEGLANFVGGRRANYRALKKTGLFGENSNKELKFEEIIFYKFRDVHDYRAHTTLYYEVSTALIEFINVHSGKTVLKRYINDLMRTDTNYYRLLWASLAFKDEKDFKKTFLSFIRKNIKKL